jgi:heat shock protein HtpX
MPPSDEIAANDRRARRLTSEATVLPLVLGLLVGLLLGGPIVALLLGAVLGAATWWWVSNAGPAHVRRAIGGRRADPVTDARLFNLVDGLCTAAGVPRPELLVIDDPAPNALAYGLGPKHASLAVTTGLLERLALVELEGVLARELARIKHHDTRPATVAVPLLPLVGRIGPLRERVATMADGGGATLADANGVALTRYPPGLVAALERLRTDGSQVRAGSDATAHLWVEPPSGDAPTHPHPPLEERIAALREL